MGRLQTGRLENFIRRWGSIKGGGSILSESLGDVFPVLDLENLTPENQLTAGWTPWWGFVTVIGVAAQIAGASLVNILDSGLIVVVDLLNIRTETIGSGTVTIGTSRPLFPLSAGVVSRDTRAPGPVGGVRIGADANVGANETGFVIRMVANVDREVVVPNGVAVLSPGTQLAVVTSTVNQDLTVSFTGRVRIAEPSELSF